MKSLHASNTGYTNSNKSVFSTNVIFPSWEKMRENSLMFLTAVRGEDVFMCELILPLERTRTQGSLAQSSHLKMADNTKRKDEPRTWLSSCTMSPLLRHRHRHLHDHHRHHDHDRSQIFMHVYTAIIYNVSQGMEPTSNVCHKVKVSLYGIFSILECTKLAIPL